MSTPAKRQRKKDNARAAREQNEAVERRSKQVRKVRNFALLAVFVIGAIVLINSCSGDESGTAGPTGPAPSTTAPTGESGPAKASGPQAIIATNFGDITVDLDTENAPKAAGRFMKLARDGFYDGLTWHRAVPNFVIQGGDPNGDGTGGSGTPAVVGETPTDGYPLGSLAAAKAGTDPAGTFDAQFFIVTGDAGTQLPPEYARFGIVTEGLDVAREIEGLAPGGDGPPTKPAKIEKITIVER
ncbi:MAG: peptidylprolyl isomerase [Actinomycetota bacterium]